VKIFFGHDTKDRCMSIDVCHLVVREGKKEQGKSARKLKEIIRSERVRKQREGKLGSPCSCGKSYIGQTSRTFKVSS
jgi:hypothetical protein